MVGLVGTKLLLHRADGSAHCFVKENIVQKVFILYLLVRLITETTCEDLQTLCVLYLAKIMRELKRRSAVSQDSII